MAMSEDLKKVILVPWDFSENSEKALAHAYQLAQMVGDNVMLVHLIKRPRFLIGNGAKSKLHALEQEAHEKLRGEAERLSKQLAAKREELRISLEEEAYQSRQVYEVTILPYVLTYRNLSKDLAKFYSQMGVNLVVATATYQLGNKKGINLVEALRKVESERLTTVPFILVKEFPTHRYYTDVVLPLDSSKNFKESIRWVAFLSSYYHCNVNIIKAPALNASMKQGITSNTYFTKKVLDASNVIYGIKNADRNSEFLSEIEKFVKEIDADMVLVMADRINRIFPRGEITIDVPVMLINPLAKRKQYFY